MLGVLFVIAGWLLDIPSNRPVYLTDGYAQTVVHVVTDMEIADQTGPLTQLQCVDAGPTCPGTNSIMSGVWQCNHKSANR